ncbi:MAG: hypothetical protein ACE5FT_01035 [Candidatus Nanoarchaeia archaeon]
MFPNTYSAPRLIDYHALEGQSQVHIRGCHQGITLIPDEDGIEKVLFLWNENASDVKWSLPGGKIRVRSLGRSELESLGATFRGKGCEKDDLNITLKADTPYALRQKLEAFEDSFTERRVGMREVDPFREYKEELTQQLVPPTKLKPSIRILPVLRSSDVQRRYVTTTTSIRTSNNVEFLGEETLYIFEFHIARLADWVNRAILNFMYKKDRYEAQLVPLENLDDPVWNHGILHGDLAAKVLREYPSILEREIPNPGLILPQEAMLDSDSGIHQVYQG